MLNNKAKEIKVGTNKMDKEGKVPQFQEKFLWVGKGGGGGVLKYKRERQREADDFVKVDRRRDEKTEIKSHWKGNEGMKMFLWIRVVKETDREKAKMEWVMREKGKRNQKREKIERDLKLWDGKE